MYISNIHLPEGQTPSNGKTKPFVNSSLRLIQKKLAIGSSNDAYEVEADRVADQVVGMNESQINQTNQAGALVQRKCAGCSQEEEIQKKPIADTITPLIQMSGTKSAGEGMASASLTQQINSSKGGGHSMDQGTKGFMESRFGTDFSAVKIHTNSTAVQMSRDINAQAFAVGNDVYFNEGKYNPSSTAGKHLLAHELTHTIQQGGKETGIQKVAERGDPIHDRLEEEYRRDRRIPENVPVSHHSREYGSWLNNNVAALNAFDTHQLMPNHLVILDIQKRFRGMTLEQLNDYREEYILNGANNTQVVTHISSIMLGMPLQACTAKEQKATQQRATSILATIPSVLGKANIAITRLHGAWINNKGSLLKGKKKLTGEVSCAFKSNFNIDEKNADYGVAHIRLMFRLRQLRGRLKQPIAFSCKAINDPVCLSGKGLDADGYVVNHKSPIHLCHGFRNSGELNHQTAIIIHEVFHLLSGVKDKGGYSPLGAHLMTCSKGLKFSANHNQLLGSADSLAGFLLHIDQTNPRDLKVR